MGIGMRLHLDFLSGYSYIEYIMIGSLQHSSPFPVTERGKEKKGIRIVFVNKKLTATAAGTDKETLSRKKTGHFFSPRGQGR